MLAIAFRPSCLSVNPAHLASGTIEKETLSTDKRISASARMIYFCFSFDHCSLIKEALYITHLKPSFDR
jgi:hypothetical protein